MTKNKLLLLLALLMTAATGVWAKGDTSWTSGDCTVTLSGGTLTISKTSGNGAMADYTGAINSQPWAGSKNQITSVVVQSGVTKIGKYSFTQFTNIQSVSLPAGLQTIGEAAFRGITNTNFTSVTIPSSVTTFGNNAFDGCNKLTSVTLPASLTNSGAGSNVFKGCTSLTSVTIPDGVESIGGYYFQNCSSLASITIPASVKSIGIYAFDGCTSLATVTIYGSPAIQSNAFPAGVSATINLTAHQGETGEYWTTFHNAGFNFQTDANTQVFKVALSGTTLTMNEVDNGIVDAGTAVVLKTTSENIAMTSTTSTSSDEQTNNLIGVTATAGKSSDGTFYVLDNGASGIGFYRLASGGKVPVGNAYLTSDSESDFFSIGGGSGSETQQVTLATNTDQFSYTSGVVTVTVTSVDGSYGAYVYDDTPMTISCGDGNVLQSVVLRLGWYSEDASTVTATPGSCQVSGSGDGSTFVTVTGINQSSVTIGGSVGVDVDQVVVNYTEAPAEPSTYTVSFAENTEDADNWTGKAGDATEYQKLPLEGVAEGAALTLKYTGTKKVIGVKAEKKAAAPAAVLSGALVDGAIIKVNFKWRGMNSGDYVQGVYNAASGTFTVSKGGDDWNLDDRAVYKVEKSGDNIIIGASFNNFSESEAMVWTFNTTNDTYTTTNGTTVNAHPDWYGLISVTLNGTDITSQLTAQ